MYTGTRVRFSRGARCSSCGLVTAVVDSRQLYAAYEAQGIRFTRCAGCDLSLDVPNSEIQVIHRELPGLPRINRNEWVTYE